MVFKTLPQQDEALYLKQIAQLYAEEGWSCGRIGGRYKLKTERIKEDLARAGVSIRNQGWHMVKDWSQDISKIVELYRDGMTVRQIAKRFDSTITTISDILKREGTIPLTAPQRRCAALAKHELDIVEAYKRGTTLKALAKQYSASYPLLRSILQIRGIEIRKPGEYDTSPAKRARKTRQVNTSAIVGFYVEERWPVERIARHLRMDEGGVSRALRESGVKIDQYRRARLTDEQENEVVNMYTTGARIKDIQKTVGHRYVTVRAALVKHGIAIRSRLQINTRRFGYIGTYRHLLFRSLMELSFILDHEGDHYIESAEVYPIIYQDGERKRTYYPDFLLNHTCLVEVKPPSYLNDAKVVAKAKAARAYCARNGWQYVITDWPVDKERIGRLVQSGHVHITNRTPQEVATYLGFAYAV